MTAPRRILCVTRMLPGGRLDGLHALFDIRGNAPMVYVRAPA